MNQQKQQEQMLRASIRNEHPPDRERLHARIVDLSEGHSRTECAAQTKLFGRNEFVRYIHGMRAAEIIEQIKLLPPVERQKIRDFVNSEAFQKALECKYVSNEEFERVAAEIFRKYDGLFRMLAEAEKADRPK